MNYYKQLLKKEPEFDPEKGPIYKITIDSLVWHIFEIRNN